MNVAVLLAGGSGRRMGGPEPKQFIMVSGRSILEHSIRAFHSHPQVDEIVIVAHTDYIDRIQEIAAPYPKVKHIVPGGKERYDSSLAAIGIYKSVRSEVLAATERLDKPWREDEALAEGKGVRSDLNLLIHDAVRPLVSQRIISDCIAALQTYKAVDVAIPCTDTIVEVNAEGHICHITPRAMLRNVQTPQCFRLETIAEAYEKGLADPEFITTDDCGVVHRYLPEEPIYVVEGETTNIKVTYPEDLILAEKILSKN